MAAYVAPINGFIVDSPEIDFIRCDAKKFSFKNVKTANFSNTSNVMEIAAGWSQYPLAFIDSSKTLELGFSSADFTMDIFGLANNLTAAASTEASLRSDLFEVTTGLIVIIPELYALNPENNVFVDGFTMGTATAAAGVCKVETVTNTTKITFYTGEVAVGDYVLVSYYHTPVNGKAISVLTTTNGGRGQLFARYPVYSGGSTCTDAAVKGYLTLNIYRCRVTEMPGLDSSYKSESNPALKFSAMDPKRPDKKMFSLTYEPVA